MFETFIAYCLMICDKLCLLLFSLRICFSHDTSLYQNFNQFSTEKVYYYDFEYLFMSL